MRGDLEAVWPGQLNDPLVHAFLDHVPQRLALGERIDTSDDGRVRRLSCAVRIFGLPTDDELGFEVSWGPALAPTSTTLDLPGVRQVAASAVSFVKDGPASSAT